MSTHLAEFGRIDQTKDVAYFVRFLDEACAQESVQAYKRHMNRLLGLRDGRRILDVGCGTGDDCRAMAELVAPGGQIVGIDNSQAMIDVANQRAASLPRQRGECVFRVADAMAMPFDADSFDATRADRSLMHVPDVVQVLKEMVRVTKPGGPIVVFEVDFETITIDADDRMLARKVAHTWCDGFTNGWLGRRMPRLFHELKLRDISVTPYVMILTPGMAVPVLGAATTQKAIANGTITAAEGQAWLAHLDDLERTGRFFSTMTGYLASGCK
jgi:ubiquinone/menaquinone biosynthesis C-methylase UbiE